MIIEFIELGIRDKCEACRAFFHNEFNKFNNTGARMLYSIYYMALKLLKTCIFGVKNKYFATFTEL